MSQKTYFYKKIIAVTAAEVVLGLPRLREISIQNIGAEDVQIEFDNPIDTASTSLTAAQGTPYNWGFGPDKLYYKGSGDTTLIVTGVRQYKEDPT